MAAAIGAIGLTILTGTTGQLSLAHAFFVASAPTATATSPAASGLGVSAACGPRAAAGARDGARGRARRAGGRALQPDLRPAARHLPRHRVDRPGLHRPAHPVQRDRPDGRLQRPRRGAVQPRSASRSAPSDPELTIVGVPFEETRAALVPRPGARRARLLLRAPARRRPARPRAGDRARQRGRRGRHRRRRHALQGRGVHGLLDVRRARRRAAGAGLRPHRARELRPRPVGRVPGDDRHRRPRLDPRRGARRRLRLDAAEGARPLQRLAAVPRRRRVGRRRRARPGRALRLRRGDRRRPPLRARRDRRPVARLAPSAAIDVPLPRREPHERSYRPACWRSGSTLLLARRLRGLRQGRRRRSVGGGSGDVKTGPGVTADTITLGQLTDLSGVFAPLASAFTQAQELYWDSRTPRAASAAARSSSSPRTPPTTSRRRSRCTATSSPTSRRISQVVGSPIIAALLPSFEKDSMLAVAAAWPPAFLDAETVAILGATYDIEAINGIEWLMENKGLKEGDTIGDLYFEGDFGEGGLIGVKYAAEKHGLKVVEQKIKATDEDMSARRREVQARGRQGDLGDDRARPARVARGRRQVDRASTCRSGPTARCSRRSCSRPPVGDDARQERHRVQQRRRRTRRTTRRPRRSRRPTRRRTRRASRSRRSLTGYSEAQVMKAVLDKACENKDLSREGIVKAFRELKGVDTGGLVAGDARLHAGRPGLLEGRLRARRRQEHAGRPEDRRRRPQLRDRGELRAQGRVALPTQLPPPRDSPARPLAGRAG